MAGIFVSKLFHISVHGFVDVFLGLLRAGWTHAFISDLAHSLEDINGGWVPARFRPLEA